MEEARQSILEFEHRTHARDILGRRLWNQLKAGASPKQHPFAAWVREGVHVVDNYTPGTIFTHIKKLVSNNINRYNDWGVVTPTDRNKTMKLGPYKLHVPFHCGIANKKLFKCSAPHKFDCDKLKGHDDQKGFCTKKAEQCRRRHSLNSRRDKTYRKKKVYQKRSGLGREYLNTELNKSEVILYTVKHRDGKKILSGFLFGREKIIDRVPYFYISIVCSSMRTGVSLLRKAEEYALTNKHWYSDDSEEHGAFHGRRHMFLFAAHYPGKTIGSNKLVSIYKEKYGYGPRVNMCRNDTRTQRMLTRDIHTAGGDGVQACRTFGKSAKCSKKYLKPFDYNNLDKNGDFPHNVPFDSHHGWGLSKCMYKKKHGDACTTTRTKRKGKVDGAYPRKRTLKSGKEMIYGNQRCIANKQKKK